MAVVRLLRLTDAKLCSDRLLLRLPARLPGLSLPSASGLYKATYNTIKISVFFPKPVHGQNGNSDKRRTPQLEKGKVKCKCNCRCCCCCLREDEEPKQQRFLRLKKPGFIFVKRLNLETGD